jgi:hypothetical protein
MGEQFEASDPNAGLFPGHEQWRRCGAVGLTIIAAQISRRVLRVPLSIWPFLCAINLSHAINSYALDKRIGLVHYSTHAITSHTI